MLTSELNFLATRRWPGEVLRLCGTDWVPLVAKEIEELRGLLRPLMPETYGDNLRLFKFINFLLETGVALRQLDRGATEASPRPRSSCQASGMDAR